MTASRKRPDSRGSAECAGESGARFDVVSFGEPMYEFSQIPGKSREYLQGFGGDTMNCAIAAARQGARVAYVTRVGEDEFARQMFRLWEEEGIDASAVSSDPQAHTAVYFISHGQDGHTFSYLRKNSAASRFSAADLPAEMLQSTRFFYTSGITQAISGSARAAVFTAIEIARGAGARVVFDANFRPALWSIDQAREVIRSTIALTDYFLLSLEDAQSLTGLAEPGQILDWCMAAGASVAILKLGAKGAVYSDGRVKKTVDGFKVNAVDATGAGDCFAGALMARLSVNDELNAAVTYACAAAALTCTGFGAIDPVPGMKQVVSLIAARGGEVAAGASR
jgi:2-dehydro-3-deoxygluconokinase